MRLLYAIKTAKKKEETGKKSLVSRQIPTSLYIFRPVTRADVMAVLIALEDTIVEGLQKGEIVRM